MTRDELISRVRAILPAVACASDSLNSLLDAPAWDESYKVEREPRINEEALREIRALAEDLADACDLFRPERQPRPPVLELDAGVDGLVLGGFAGMFLGSSVARAALAGASYQAIDQHLKRTAATTSSAHVEHEVQRGESWESIAKKYDVDLARLIRFNGKDWIEARPRDEWGEHPGHWPPLGWPKTVKVPGPVQK